MNYLAELMPFLRSVHIFGSQRHEVARFEARYLDVTQRDLRLYAVNNLVTPVYHTAGALVVLGIVFFGVWLAAGSPRGAAWVIPFVLLFVRFLPILNEMNLALSYLADGFVSYEKLEAELATLRGRRMQEGDRRFPAAFDTLELHRVSFAYEPDAPVLEDISLAIPRGRHVAVVGPSGCGKSTLCLLLCRLYDPTGGSVSVDGTDLKTFSLASLRDAITLVEQTPVLLNDTVRANIAYGWPDSSDADIRFAAKRAHADDFISEFPQGYETNVGNLGTAISGGQRQRIAIARALVRSPQVLILDEATSAVDSVSETLIKESIEELRGDVTIVSVAHRLSTIRNADEIHFMSGGRIACSGTFAELLAKHAEFREYVRAQDLSDAT
jgi:ABC-type multidrug transport system fused ATPase/permease subunit